MVISVRQTMVACSEMFTLIVFPSSLRRAKRMRQTIQARQLVRMVSSGKEIHFSFPNLPRTLHEFVSG